NKLFAVFVISMFPIVELRGAIPIGVGLDLELWKVFVVSVIGNMIPVPFIILFVRPIIEYLAKTKRFSKFAGWLTERTMSKSEKITKYKMFGLFVFVAIPLPGTGAWTGSMLAGLMDMRLKDAVPMIFAGVITAGIIMLLISYGLGALILNLFA
ncbi:MAG: small multi-drug export protein, partial [Clostridia bacterium]|nr:small multi-drug export protein [Clostridia bacterium]